MQKLILFMLCLVFIPAVIAQGSQEVSDWSMGEGATGENELTVNSGDYAGTYNMDPDDDNEMPSRSSFSGYPVEIQNFYGGIKFGIAPGDMDYCPTDFCSDRWTMTTSGFRADGVGVKLKRNIPIQKRNPNPGVQCGSITCSNGQASRECSRWVLEELRVEYTDVIFRTTEYHVACKCRLDPFVLIAECPGPFICPVGWKPKPVQNARCQGGCDGNQCAEPATVRHCCDKDAVITEDPSSGDGSGEQQERVDESNEQSLYDNTFQEGGESAQYATSRKTSFQSSKMGYAFLGSNISLKVIAISAILCLLFLVWKAER